MANRLNRLTHNDVSHIKTAMPTFAYSFPSEFCEPFSLAPDQLLLALSNPLLETGDMKKSLQHLLIEGIGDNLPGLGHLLTQVKDRKASLLSRYNVQSTLSELRKKKLDRREGILQEGTGLPDRRGAAQDDDKQGGGGVLDFREEKQRAQRSSTPPFVSIVELLEALAEQVRFTGTEVLAAEESAEFLERLTLLLKVERDLQRAIWGFDLEAIDSRSIGEVLGNESRQIWETLKLVKDTLLEAGLLQEWKDTHRLSRKAFHMLSSKLLKDIVDLLKHGGAGDRVSRFAIGGGIDNTLTRPYDFSLPLNLNIPRTLMNTVMRQGQKLPLVLKPDDFEVYEPERTTRCATVLMLDMSKSMKDRNNFLTAKKVVLALNDLIQRKFPRDALTVVGFSTIARVLPPEDLPYVLWDAGQPYTNIQDGLRLSSKILRRQGIRSRHIILITDGEPTAHSENGRLFFQFPPHPRSLEQTLEEVKRCTRQGIVISTFMLAKSNPLTNFVEELTKINQGRAYFADADHLGQSIIVNYLIGRQRSP